jgi:hypothetical protein
MSAQLSKLHVRFIQSQKNFFLITDTGSKQEKLPISQLYVKDNSSFYLINEGKPLNEDEKLSIFFKEETHALKELQCDVTKQEIAHGSEEFEDALLFFNVDTSKIKQLFLLQINSLDEK